MKKTGLAVLLVLIAVSFISAEQRLNEKGFELTWETEADKLIVTLRAPTTGWISFGIGAEDVMKGANIIILWVDDDTGIAMAEDQYGHSRFGHKNDLKLGGTQDVQVLSGKQTQTHTEITFSIPMDSGDEYDKVLVRGESYRMLLASNKSDNINWKHNMKYASDIEIR